MLKVVLQQKLPHLSPGSESEKGPLAQQNRRGAYQRCLRGRSRFPIRNACCRPTIVSGLPQKLCLQTLFPPKTRHDTPMAKSPRGDRTKTRHACASSGAARSPSLLRWASGMHPDTYILDVNRNPVAEPISSGPQDANGLRVIAVLPFFVAPAFSGTSTFPGLVSDHSVRVPAVSRGCRWFRGFRVTAMRAVSADAAGLLRAMMAPLRPSRKDCPAFRPFRC